MNTIGNTKTLKQRGLSLLLAIMLVMGPLLSNVQPVSAAAITKDGDVDTETIVTGAGENAYDVTLRIYGKTAKSPIPRDVVLVLDTSGTMGKQVNVAPWNAEYGEYYPEQITTLVEQMKKNAVGFVNDFFSAPGNTSRISIVTFDNDAYQKTDLLGAADKGQLITAINEIQHNPMGNTYTNRGLAKAEQILTAAGSSKDSVVILLSDGRPWYGGQGNAEGDAINAATSLKTKATVYTIGYGLDTTNETDAATVLTSIASSPDKFYNTKARDIGTTFSTLANQVKEFPMFTNGSVTDFIAPGFELDTNYPVTVNNGTFNNPVWSIPSLSLRTSEAAASENLRYKAADIYYSEVKFRVKTVPSQLSSNTDINGSGEYNIIKAAPVGYKNATGASATVNLEKGYGPVNLQKTATPVFDTVVEGDTSVTLTVTGEPAGTVVTVKFPNGDTATGTVKDNTGKVTIDVPTGTTIGKGDTITAIAKNPNKLDSDPGTTTSIAKVIADPQTIPSTHVRVTFTAGPNGRLEGTTTFAVKKGMTIAEFKAYDLNNGTPAQGQAEPFADPLLASAPTPVADTGFVFGTWTPDYDNNNTIVFNVDTDFLANFVPASEPVVSEPTKAEPTKQEPVAPEAPAGTVKPGPKTGDESPVEAGIALLIASALLGGLAVSKRRKEN